MLHCDSENVREGDLCVGVLKRSVKWHLMDDAKKVCDVSLVIMLSLTDPEEHMQMLRKMVGVIRDQELVAKVVACNTLSEAYLLLKGHLS